ncbi:hypothetical protein [Streptomyces smyrnaeus]|uniref:hypothetical protein n=1 Tax=Streptomyces smyrnaeus TaxID=1387713 RepID=UPI0033C02288
MTRKWPEVFAEFDPIGRRIAAAFNQERIEGGGWDHIVHDTAYGSISLRHPCGWTLHLMHHKPHTRSARLEVNGSYPTRNPYRAAPCPEPIYVGMHTAPRRIARDIARRFLPHYIQAWKKAEALRTKDEQNARARATRNRQIEAILPAARPSCAESPRHTTERHVSYFYGRDARDSTQVHARVGSGKIELDADAEHATLELTGVPAPLLLTILEILSVSRPLTGRLVPAVEPARHELPPAAHTVPGEVIGRSQPPLPERRAEPGTSQ